MRFLVSGIFGLSFVGSLLAEPSLTIYNQDFAIVRDYFELDLKKGVNQVEFPNVTSGLEPDSVMMRPEESSESFKIMEQNYRSDVISQPLLLSHYEGQEIDFLVRENDKTVTKKGKIIRSGYQPVQFQNQLRNNPYASSQPLIEMDGQLRFNLPGTPLFPKLSDTSLLKPTLQWKIQSDQSEKVGVEISYMSRGFNWESDYNLVLGSDEQSLDLSAWITLQNSSGKAFEGAKIKLMAGDVHKIKELESTYRSRMKGAVLASSFSRMSPVKEKSFDEFHLYHLQNKTNLKNLETKQVEFLKVSGIKAKRIYVYEGADLSSYRHTSMESIRGNREYGTKSHSKVSVFQEFENTKENGLGVALPKGKLRFYKKDEDDQLEFVGENLIDHTPKDETVRVYTGNSFDLVGERKRVDFQYDSRTKKVEEEFEMTLKNKKETAVEIRVIERLNRWTGWEILSKSNYYNKLDAHTIEFRILLQPDEEKKLSYRVLYTW